jgi:1,4-alpha-glucan branching enzyme
MPVHDEFRSRKNHKMSIEKKYLKVKPVCRVKFVLDENQYNSVDSIILAGDFNDWQAGGTALKKTKNGTWSVTCDFAPGSEIQFRYLINGTQWDNDPEADRSVANVFGSENSVIVI